MVVVGLRFTLKLCFGLCCWLALLHGEFPAAFHSAECLPQIEQAQSQSPEDAAAGGPETPQSSEVVVHSKPGTQAHLQPGPGTVLFSQKTSGMSCTLPEPLFPNCKAGEIIAFIPQGG